MNHLHLLYRGPAELCSRAVCLIMCRLVRTVALQLAQHVSLAGWCLARPHAGDAGDARHGGRVGLALSQIEIVLLAPKSRLDRGPGNSARQPGPSTPPTRSIMHDPGSSRVFLHPMRALLRSFSARHASGRAHDRRLTAASVSTPTRPNAPSQYKPPSHCSRAGWPSGPRFFPIPAKITLQAEAAGGASRIDEPTASTAVQPPSRAAAQRGNRRSGAPAPAG